MGRIGQMMLQQGNHHNYVLHVINGPDEQTCLTANHPKIWRLILKCKKAAAFGSHVLLPKLNGCGMVWLKHLKLATPK